MMTVAPMNLKPLPYALPLNFAQGHYNSHDYQTLGTFSCTKV